MTHERFGENYWRLVSRRRTEASAAWRKSGDPDASSLSVGYVVG